MKINPSLGEIVSSTSQRKIGHAHCAWSFSHPRNEGTCIFFFYFTFSLESWIYIGSKMRQHSEGLANYRQRIQYIYRISLPNGYHSRGSRLGAFATTTTTTQRRETILYTPHRMGRKTLSYTRNHETDTPPYRYFPSPPHPKLGTRWTAHTEYVSSVFSHTYI